MKNIFLLILAASFLTVFKSNTASKQLLSNPTVALKQAKNCTVYENNIRKFITHLIKAPLSPDLGNDMVYTNIADFTHADVFDKYSGKYLINFKAILGKSKTKKRVVFSKQVISNNLKVEVKIYPSDIKEAKRRDFEVNLIVPNIDYSNVRQVKDIYLNPSNNKRYMKIVTLQGQESSHEIVLSEGSGAGQDVSYIGWNYKCLE